MGGWTQTESIVICNDLGYEFTGKFINISTCFDSENADISLKRSYSLAN